MDALGVLIGSGVSGDESEELTTSEVETPLSSESCASKFRLVTRVCSSETGFRGRNSATLTLRVVEASVDGDGEGGGVAGRPWFSFEYSFE